MSPASTVSSDSVIGLGGGRVTATPRGRSTDLFSGGSALAIADLVSTNEYGLLLWGLWAALCGVWRWFFFLFCAFVIFLSFLCAGHFWRF